MNQTSPISPEKFIMRDRDLMGGIPVFVGTRVPVRTLFDYLEADHSLEEFFDDFPTVTHHQANAVLELAKEKLLTQIPEAA